MNKQTQFFINAWKPMAELDDLLAEQAAEAAHHITERFTLKQKPDVLATPAQDFRLEVIVRKESVTGEHNTTYACALLELSLSAVSTTACRETYIETVKLLREATREAMALPPVPTRIVVRLRKTRKYRHPLLLAE